MAGISRSRSISVLVFRNWTEIGRGAGCRSNRGVSTGRFSRNLQQANRAGIEITPITHTTAIGRESGVRTSQTRTRAATGGTTAGSPKSVMNWAEFT